MPDEPREGTFQRLVESAKVALFVYEKTFVYANPAAIELSGYSLEQLSELSADDLFLSEAPPPDTWTATPERPPIRLKRRDGALRRVSLHLSGVDFEGRRAIQAAVVPEPDSAHAERTLRMLAKAFETTQLGITISDPEGRILFTNQAEADMHGYQVEDLVGRDVRVFSPPELWRPMTRRELHDLHRLRRETVNRHRLGHVFPVCLLSDVVFDGDGEPLAIVTICEDMTAQRQADEERAALEVQLRQAQKMEAVGQLAGGVAHDFNNLLVVIKGHVELALKSLDPAHAVVYHLIQTRDAADKAASVTRQLLAFGRRQELAPRPVTLDSVVREVLEILQRTLPEHIELSFEAGLGRAARVHVDPAQIEQVIINLCINARDALAEPGEIHLSTDEAFIDPRFCEAHTWAREGRFARLRVRDSGVGMDEETLSHIFEPFFTTKAEGKGTGLGLATVYGIVEQHHGFLHVDSQLGAGTTVTIYLPLPDVDPETFDETAVNLDETVARGGHETVLVAEDDARVRQVMVSVLEKAGYTVLKARDGAEAVKIFRTHADRVSLAILDLVMPVMSGILAREDIRQVRPEVRVLFTTGYATDGGDLQVLGDTPLILKPFSYEALLKKVREILDR